MAAAKTQTELTLDLEQILRRRLFWLGLLVICLYAASFVQFGWIDKWAAPADKRVNDGRHATFFAVDINPYYLFSEDFHLYVVRAKRILDRGWTDSPLYSTGHEKPSYAAPLQAALMMIAVSTDGQPLPYALFIVSVLLVAWSVLYLAASHWLDPTVSPLSVLIAVLVTVLFEAVANVAHPTYEYAQWPVHRGLRMSTLAWSNPLGLAVVIASVSLLFQSARPWGRVTFIAVLLAVFAASDSWSFLLAGASAAVVIGMLTGIAIIRRWRGSAGARAAIVAGIGLAMAALLGLAIQQLTGGHLSGDAFTRAGFGNAWRHSLLGVDNLPDFRREIRAHALLVGGLAIIAAIYVQLQFTPTNRRVVSTTTFSWPSRPRLHLLCLLAVTFAAQALAVGSLARIGMDDFMRNQFAWRVDMVVLFCAVVLACESTKSVVQHMAVRLRRDPRRWELALSAAFVAALFIYHNSRIHGFIKHTAGQEFFLTADEEHLRDWLRRRDKSLGQYTLATASHELNYLAAYWTHADLLLPEGFPLHSMESNAEIEERMARLLAIYGATPASWLDFNLYRHVWDQWSWGVSRLLSARHGYMYYLLHNEIVIERDAADRTPPKGPLRTTPRFAQERLRNDQNMRSGLYDTHLAGVHVAEQIAEWLDESPALTAEAMPDVVIIDEVSRALGDPDLSDYVREFHHGDLEAWVRREKSPSSSTGG
jgi:hypothetical protein